MADYYPAAMTARAAWHQNFENILTTLATKYNILAAQVTAHSADNAWIQYWSQARFEADVFREQLTKYCNSIGGTDPSLDTPTTPNFTSFGTVPAEVPPGIDFRVRELARHIKGHSKYAVADGELLGIVSSASGSNDLTEAAPTIKLRTLTNFQLEASFKKNGADGLRLEFRHADGPWQHAAVLLSSPGQFAIAPSVAGKAEQVEVRGVFVKKNADVGNFSDTVNGFVAP